MPHLSNDGSDDDVSSEYDSDSGLSVQTDQHPFDNDAEQTSSANPANGAPDFSANFFTPRLSPPRDPNPRVKVEHAPAQIVNRGKRKADDDDDRESSAHDAKSRRLSASRSDTSASSSAFSTADNGYDNDGIDGQHHAPAAGVPAPRLHPAFPKTGGQLYEEHFPGKKITGYGRTDILAVRPVKRIPVIFKNFRDHKIQNIAAWLMQATGELLPNDVSCARCQKGSTIFGRNCVVLPDAQMKRVTRNTCANCWYNRNGNCCTIRWGNEGETLAGLRKRRGPAPYDQAVSLPSDARSQVTPYTQPPPARRTEPLPGHATALEIFRTAAQSNGNASSNEFPTTAIDLLTSMGQPPAVPVDIPKPAPDRPDDSNSYQPTVSSKSYSQTAVAAPATVRSPSDSLDGKVGSWEKRYDKMPTQELLEMQRVLVERLEDTTMRMVAMQKVLAGRQLLS